MVAGRARWLGVALRNLSASVAVVSLDASAGEAWELALARWPCSAFLLAEDDAEGVEGLATAVSRLHMPMLSRLLLWASAPTLRRHEVAERLGAAQALPCWTHHAVLVTASDHRRDTRAYSEQCEPQPVELRAVRLQELVAPAGGRGGLLPLLPPVCEGWQRGAPLQVVILKAAGHASDVSLNLLEALRVAVPGIRVLFEGDLLTVHRLFMNCSLGFIMYPSSNVAIPARITFEFPWQMLRLLVVVPVGLGTPRPFYGVVGEFSATLWCATGLAVALVLVASFAMACGWRRGLRWSALWDAVRTAFAPLLGQAAPETEGQRLLLGVWLLACVVLSAAYTGELLADLSAKHRLEINSVEELAASGLTIKVWFQLLAATYAIFPAEVSSRIQVADRNVSTEIAEVALHRRAALILDDDLIVHVGPWLADSAQVHVFYVTTQLPASIFAATAGSPLARPFQRVVGRARAGGLVVKWWQSWTAKRLRAVLDEHPGLGAEMHLLGGEWQAKDTGPRVLTMQNLAPAFAVLALGLSLSALALCFELVWSLGRRSVCCKSNRDA